MCGRFTTTAPADILAAEFGLEEVSAAFRPSFNVAPTHMVPVVTGRSKRALELFQWGLIPPWSGDRGQPGRMINARSESVASKPSFREAFKKRRCLVLADGFYEWKKAVGRKIPMYIRLADKRPFAFACLWEGWLSPDGEVVRTCTIITTPPNDLLEPIHDRMPAILSPDTRDAWLETADIELLTPYPADEMEAFSVSTLVNSPRNDTPECIAHEQPKGTLPLFPDWPSFSG